MSRSICFQEVGVRSQLQQSFIDESPDCDVLLVFLVVITIIIDIIDILVSRSPCEGISGQSPLSSLAFESSRCRLVVKKALAILMLD